jgi:glycosyltransferase involved in cell wall biosynthesis
MKILFLSSRYPPQAKGGAEISTALTAEALAARGHVVRVVTAGRPRSCQEVNGVEVVRSPLPLLAKPLLEERHSRRAARALLAEIGAPEGYDVIHAHDFRTAQALNELAWPKTVVTVRDYALICGTTNAILRDGTRCTCSWRDVVRTQRVHEASWARKPFRIWQYRYNIAYRRRSLGGFTRQIFISEAQRREIAQQFDLSGVTSTVIYNPVPSAYLNDKLNGGTVGNVLYVGTVEEYKGVGLLLHAWRSVARQVPHAKLKIVGEGAQRREYERLIERWGLQYRVAFAGRIPWSRLQSHLDEAAIVVAPHLWVEPFGRTVAEAMARGKVVVAADRGGPSEMLQHGKTGLLFKPGSAQALERGLLDALALPDTQRRELGRAAHEWTRRELRPDTVALQHEEFYLELPKSRA